MQIPSIFEFVMLQSWTNAMLKLISRVVLLGASAVLLSACQHTQKALNTVNIYTAPKPNLERNIQVYCAGTDDCEFERMDHTPIVNDVTHLVNHEAIQKGYIRLKTGLTTLQSNALYLTAPAGQHEVVMRFYPISRERAEKITVIHNFIAGQSYTFKMYRDRSKRAASLLSVSAPEPLCVALIEGQRTVRRFCKPYNVMTGLGEFIEQKNQS